VLSRPSTKYSRMETSRPDLGVFDMVWKRGKDVTRASSTSCYCRLSLQFGLPRIPILAYRNSVGLLRVALGLADAELLPSSPAVANRRIHTVVPAAIQLMPILNREE
jgi:hypothetical protein